MSALTKALFIIVLSLATTILLTLAFAARAGLEAVRVAPLVVIAIGVIGLILGLVIKWSQPNAAPSITSSDIGALPNQRHTSKAEETLQADPAFMLFAQALASATTTERLRIALTRHLPPLVGHQRLWITSHLRGRTRVIVPEGIEGTPRERLLDQASQEWTTFLLRIDTDVVGVLGVESGSGLSARIKQVIAGVAPFIAQALQTAHTIETLRETSLIDLLTGVATRREGLTRLGAEIKRAQRTGLPIAVMMLDLDRFKSINDRFGHAVGDGVLTAVGHTMTQKLRASDVRCRWGGEEFLIVLPETDLSRAQVVATGLLRDIAALKVPTPVGPVSTTASIGLTITRPSETDAHGIIRRADMALYRAKAAGRACVRVVLGDRQGNAVGAGVARPAEKGRNSLVPFPDRRDPQRPDRRRVPGSGRRKTDPQSPIIENRVTNPSTADRRNQAGRR